MGRGTGNVKSSACLAMDSHFLMAGLIWRMKTCANVLPLVSAAGKRHTCQIVLELEAVFIEDARPPLGVFGTCPGAQRGSQQMAGSSLHCVGVT